MEKFEKIPLTEARRPALLEQHGELECLVQEKVALYNRNDKTRHEDGLLRLTTHRLMWHGPGDEVLGVSLALVASIELQAGFMTSSPKVSVHFSQDCYVKLSFRGGGHQAFHTRLQSTLTSGAWKKSPAAGVPAGLPPQKAEFDPSKAGIGGILQSVEESKRKTNETLEVAFSDLSALMGKAADLVQLAEKLTKKLEKEGNAEENSQMRSYLVELGIASPVTRESAGSVYHEELSKQLAEFLGRALRRHGGMITLPDLYCIFNRARGTALISPDDLHRACLLFEPLGLPYKLKKLKTSVLLVQGAEYDDAATQQRILKHIKERGSVTSLELVKLDNVSVLIAKEQLATAELAGAVCRDDSPEGVRYYDNQIRSCQWRLSG